MFALPPYTEETGEHDRTTSRRERHMFVPERRTPTDNVANVLYRAHTYVLAVALVTHTHAHTHTYTHMCTSAHTHTHTANLISQ